MGAKISSWLWGLDSSAGCLIGKSDLFVFWPVCLPFRRSRGQNFVFTLTDWCNELPDQFDWLDLFGSEMKYLNGWYIVFGIRWSMYLYRSAHSFRCFVLWYLTLITACYRWRIPFFFNYLVSAFKTNVKLLLRSIYVIHFIDLAAFKLCLKTGISSRVASLRGPGG